MCEPLMPKRQRRVDSFNVAYTALLISASCMLPEPHALKQGRLERRFCPPVSRSMMGSSPGGHASLCCAS